MRSLRTKREFLEAYLSGLVGNSLPAFRTVQDAQDSPYSLFGVRSLVPGWKTLYGKTKEELEEFREYEDLYFQVQVPKTIEDGLKIQGEVCRTPSGLYLYYSTESGLRMKEALASSTMREAHRVEALALLRENLNSRSMQMVEDLLDTYTGVIEFSTYRDKIGSILGHNTLIWEVRDY